MALNRAATVVGGLSNISGLPLTTWTAWPPVAPIELPQVPGDQNDIQFTLKGYVVTDAEESVKFRFNITYGNGTGTDTTTHETGELMLDNGRFHYQAAMTVTTPLAGDGKLIFTADAWRSSSNGTGFDLNSGVIEIFAVRATTGGTTYWSADGVVPVDLIPQVGDIWINSLDEKYTRWDGSAWVTVIDYAPLNDPDDVRSNKVGFY